jgi:putative transport protein
MDIEVTNPVVIGKKIKYLDIRKKYGVTISRIRREDIEIIPSGNMFLEMGDIVRLVGFKSSINQLKESLHGNVKKLSETNMLPYLAGICLGIILGQVPIHIPSGSVITLGSAGGVFIVSLLLGHFRKIGSLYLFVPPAAKNFGRDFGIMLFLAGVGTLAGSKIAPIIKQTGITLLLAGAIVSVVTIVTLLVLMLYVFKMDTLTTMGSMSAAMTNPPALEASTSKSKTNLPSLAYASVYPAALIFKILFVQILVLILFRFFP